jgi:DNA-binding LytR/AlgR family response regulator
MRVLVVDDEPLARARLVRMLGRIEGVEVVGEATDGADAIARAAELDPDVVLLDIDMPGVDGLAVAEHPGMKPVIFTTGHAGYAVDAFDARAVDYLLKPISQERLERALARITPRPSAEPWRLVVLDGTLRVFVDAREVACFLADQKYVAFRYRDRELLLRESLDTLETRLAPFGFLRANRGALVRRDAVVAFDAAEGGTLVLANEERVPVSRRALANVREALGV